jgi:murein DD-endopeptidase MepM/ murein hydrolase activator NlpD
VAGVSLVLVAVPFWLVTVWAAPATPVVTTPTPVPTNTPTPVDLHRLLLLTPAAQRTGGLVFLPLLFQNAGERGSDVNPATFTYEVKPGDTLWSLALDFGRDLDTMSCATTPTGSDAEKLVPGETITVPALDDLCYTVTPGDTLASIAARHGLSVPDIVSVSWNGFSVPPYPVRPRQRVLLPGARPDARPRPERRAVSFATDSWAQTAWPDWPYGDGKFIWPVLGWISQGSRAGHRAIDIAVPIGTPVRAADRGKVVYAGWNPTGYGFRVVIDHGIDYVTLYAHLSDIYVTPGQIVGKGQVIGVSGSNGNITGPHLHFEIRDYGILVDPLTLLPKR